VIGVVLLIVFALIVFILLRRRKKKNSSNGTQLEDINQLEMNDKNNNTTDSNKRNSTILDQNLELGDVLGKGNFGDVFKGKLGPLVVAVRGEILVF